MENKLNATLTIEAGEQEGKTFSLGRNKLTIGRGQVEGNRVAFSAPFISRRHADIRYSDGCFILRDLGSKNGTRVNSKSLESMTDYFLEDNDVIDLAGGLVTTRFRHTEGTIILSGLELRNLGARGIRIDEQARDVWVNGQKLEPPLALKEFDLLAFLFQNRDNACSKDDMAKQVWQEEFVTNEQIEQCVYRIRKRVEPDPSRPQHIITLRGYGYKLVSDAQPPSAI